MNLSVAILAGGLGTRLHPITEKIPKALVEVAGEPFLHHQLRLLRDCGVKRVVICAGFLGEMIETSVGNGGAFGIEVEYSFDGPQPLGTAGALYKALPGLSSRFLVLYGDSYLEIDYAAVAAAHLDSEQQGLMTIFRNRGAWGPSNVTARDGKILAYDKRTQHPDMEYLDYGLGALRADALAALVCSGVGDLAEVYQALLAQGQLAGYEARHRFYEIGSLAGLRDTDAYLRRTVTRQ